MVHYNKQKVNYYKEKNLDLFQLNNQIYKLFYQIKKNLHFHFLKIHFKVNLDLKLI